MNPWLTQFVLEESGPFTPQPAVHGQLKTSPFNVSLPPLQCGLRSRTSHWYRVYWHEDAEKDHCAEGSTVISGLLWRLGENIFYFFALDKNKLLNPCSMGVMTCERLFRGNTLLQLSKGPFTTWIWIRFGCFCKHAQVCLWCFLVHFILAFCLFFMHVSAF